VALSFSNVNEQRKKRKIMQTKNKHYDLQSHYRYGALQRRENIGEN
jgi:hypothetical protein